MDEQSFLLILTSVVAAGTILLVYFAWKARARTDATARGSPALAPTLSRTVSREADAGPHKSLNELLYDDIVSVTAGGHESIPLVLEEGDRVRGVVSESDGYTFNAYLMDEVGFGKYVNGRRVRSLWSDEDVATATLDVRIDANGTYYLVLDLYGKQLDRDISVRLRCSKGA